MMKRMIAAVSILVMLAAFVSPVLGACPSSVSASAGSTITFTETATTPAEYIYDWNQGTLTPPFTSVSADNTYQFSLQTPDCGATGEWWVELYMRPAGAPVGTCVEYCKIPITCVPSTCPCPSFVDYCLTGGVAPSWTFTCNSQSALLINEWHVTPDAASAPTQADILARTPEYQQIGKTSTYTLGATFHPTATDTTKTYWMTFAVTQDTHSTPDGVGERIIQWCAPVKVNFYYDPTATVTSAITQGNCSECIAAKAMLLIIYGGNFKVVGF